MNFAPYQWRANDGYLPPPGSIPVPDPMAATGTMPFFPYYSPFYMTASSAYPGPFQVFQPSRQPPIKATAPPPAPLPAPQKPGPKTRTKKAYYVVDKTIRELKSVAPGESSTGGNKSTAPAPAPAPTVCHSAKNPAAPSVRAGVNYMFPKEHTMLHVFNKAAPVWEGKYRGQALQFKIFKASTAFTVQDVVERIMKAGEDGKEKCKGWAATEVYEKGGGEWLKGSTIEYDSDKAGGSLASMGWNARKGKDLPPTWLVVHKL